MTRGTSSTRQPSRSPDRLDELINLRRYPVDPVEYENLLQQHQALLAAIDAVPTPASPDDGLLRHPMFQGLGPLLPDVPEDLFALDHEASATPEAASGRRASRRSRSATPSRRRVPVGSTPTLPAQSPPAGGRINGDFFDLPADFFDSSPPGARAVSAVAGGVPSPGYTPTSPAYNPVSPGYVPYSALVSSSPHLFSSSPRLPSPTCNPTSPAYNGVSPAYDPVRALYGSSPRSPVGGAIARRLDGIDAMLERLQRRVALRADRIDAQLLAITETLSNQRQGAAAPNNDRKRKRSSDNREVVNLTGKTPSPKSPKKVDFVDLVTDTSWSGSEFSSSGSSSSSSNSLSSSSDSTDDDDDDDDKPSSPSKKPKPSPKSSLFSSPRSPKTPPNNRTPSPPRTPRKAPPKRPAPRTPPRQRAPSVPVTPSAPRNTRAAAASRSPAARTPRTPPQQTAPATPAAPRKNRSRSREPTASPTPAAAPTAAPAPARQPTRASSRIRERAAGTAYRPLLEKRITGRGVRSCPR